MSNIRRKKTFLKHIAMMGIFALACAFACADPRDPNYPVWSISTKVSGAGFDEPGRLASGDINGDGFSDVIVGTNGAVALLADDRESSGAVIALLGTASRPSSSSSPSPGAPTSDETHVVSAPLPGEMVRYRQLGASVASDDFNGDDFDDLVFTASYNRGFVTGGQGANDFVFSVNLLLGAPCLRSAVVDLENPTSCQTVARILLDDAGYDSVGAMTTGDFNADGFQDIAVVVIQGFDDADVLVLFGHPQLFTGTVSIEHDDLVLPVARIILDRDRPVVGGYSPQFTTPVIGLQTGDINGDGVDDIAIGDPLSDPDAGPATIPASGMEGDRIALTGRVSLVYGSVGMPGQVFDLNDTAGSNGETQLWGESFPSQFGQSIAIGDTNVDGFDDLSVGANAATAGIEAGQSGTFGLLLYGASVPPGVPAGAGSLIDTSVASSIGGFGESRLIWTPAAGIAGAMHGKVGLGDADADGRADYLMSELVAPGETIATGLTIHHSANADDGGPIFNVGAIDFESATSLDPRVACASADGPFGATQLCQQDVNRDGFADFVVSVEEGVPGLSSAFVYFTNGGADTSRGVERFTAGDSPLRGAGGRQSPANRAWVQFDGGNASAATITTLRNQTISGLPPQYTAAGSTCWRVESDRSGWESATIHVRYVDSDLSGLHEDGFELVSAPSLSGPWTRVAEQRRNTRANKFIGAVTELGYFAIAFNHDIYLEGCPTVSEILCQTNGNSLARIDTMTVVFSMPVTGVDASDFSITAPSTVPGQILSVEGSGDTYRVRVYYTTGIGWGTFRVLDNDSIRDEGNRPLGGPGANNGGVSQRTCGALAVPPAVIAMDRDYPSPNALQRVSYTVKFNVPVGGVDLADFTVGSTALEGVHIESVEGIGATRRVWIHTGTGSGTLFLRLNDDDSISDVTGATLGGTGAGNGDFQSDSYSIERSEIDVLPPAVESITRASVSPTSAVSVDFYVTFSEDVIGVDKSDFQIVTTSRVNGAEIAEVRGDTLVSVVTVSTGTGDGTIQLRLLDNDSITDLAGNVLGGTGVGNGSVLNGPIYAIYKSDPNELPPTVTSITRLDPSPTEAFSVRYRVLFDENVTGVDATDFVTSVEGLIGSGVSNVIGSADDYTVTVNTGNGVGTLRLDLRDNDSILDADQNPLGGIGSDNGHFTGGQYFQIVRDPNMTVRPLKGGGEVDRGDNVNVKWTSGDVGKNVRIELWRNGQRVTVLDKKAKNDGAQKVTIPGGIPAGSGYTIRVVSTSNANHFTDMKKPFSVQ
ncbi:MAG: FG-GAP repeat protein [Candidatus Hydrogenedentes bacterium]|nr:FG-GAP repeat protein [Candidatus Hydrogenedentota bacterium]